MKLRVLFKKNHREDLEWLRNEFGIDFIKKASLMKHHHQQFQTLRKKWQQFGISIKLVMRNLLNTIDIRSEIHAQKWGWGEKYFFRSALLWLHSEAKKGKNLS